MKYHIAVCVESNGVRYGFVISGKNETEAVRFAETFSNRVGYVGDGGDFAKAVKRAGMMERNERGAWGSL